MIKKLRPVALYFFLIFSSTLQAQSDYSNFAQQTNRLTAISKTYPQLAKLKSITKTEGGKDIWMMTIGTGNTETKPGIAIIGGVEGNHLLGTEMAIGFAEKITRDNNTNSIKKLLAKTTFYVFPNMSPDAMEQYFAGLKYERKGNAASTDDDRDGKTNEDGFDDLDGNGKIGWLRVESPIGEYKTHPDDERVLIKANLTKGEKGKYLLLTEGIDNDKDGNFNEDGEGGVAFNKNFSFKHPSFTPGSGEFAVSENETRALLDNLYQLFNVYAVVSFSSNNNLSSPFKYVPALTTPRIITGWLEPDTRVNAMVSELYKRTTKITDTSKSTPAGGDFLSWAYFHYGRYSFSTPGWLIPKFKPDTTKNEKLLAVEDSSADYMRWIAGQGINAPYTNWKKIQHPDFPGQTVEVGGLDPYVLINPPFKMADSITGKHSDFIIKLAGYQPELDIAKIKTEKLEAGFTRITASIVNKGVFASHTKLGERSYWVKRINVKLNTQANQSLISGKKIQVLNSLEGLSEKELTWLVKGSGKIVLEAGSPTTGTKRTEINL